MGDDAAVVELARQQHGLVTRGQALGLGLTRRAIDGRCAKGVWTPMALGVYAVGGAPRTWRQQVMAACLAGGELGAASHRTAAALHGFDGFRPDVVEIVTPRRRRYRTDDATVHTSLDLLAVDVTTVDGVPVTTAARTLIDLGAVVRPERVEEALDAALRDGQTSLPFVRWRLAQVRRKGRTGVGAIAPLVEARQAGRRPESRYERALLRALVASGLPPPVPQYEVRDAGRLLARVDFAYPELKLAIEVDGHQGHATRQQRQHDAFRTGELVARQWRVLPITTDDVFERIDEVCARVARALCAPPALAPRLLVS